MESNPVGAIDTKPSSGPQAFQIFTIGDYVVETHMKDVWALCLDAQRSKSVEVLFILSIL